MNAPVSLANRRAPLRAGSLCLGNGLDIDYAERGDPDGLPLLLMHGYTDSRRSFDALLGLLPTTIRAVAFSHRGHGESGKPRSHYDASVLAADAIDVMDRLAIERAVVVGHSMGSLVAQRVALTRPDRVLGLVLIGAFRTLKGNAAVEAFWQETAATLRDPVDPAIARDFQQSGLASALAPDVFATIVDESLKVPAHVWRSTLRGLMDEDFSAALAAIAAPTLILWGDRDVFCGRAEQAALAASIPDARLIAYAEVGHSPHWEQPARAATDIVAFLDRLQIVTAAAPRPRALAVGG